jgi:hypothetical protein
MGTQRLLPVEGEVFAFLQLRPNETKDSVVRTKRILDRFMPLVDWSRHPKIGPAGNGEHDSLPPVEREM